MTPFWSRLRSRSAARRITSSPAIVIQPRGPAGATWTLTPVSWSICRNDPRGVGDCRAAGGGLAAGRRCASGARSTSRCRWSSRRARGPDRRRRHRAETARPSDDRGDHRCAAVDRGGGAGGRDGCVARLSASDRSLRLPSRAASRPSAPRVRSSPMGGWGYRASASTTTRRCT